MVWPRVLKIVGSILSFIGIVGIILSNMLSQIFIMTITMISGLFAISLSSQIS